MRTDDALAAVHPHAITLSVPDLDAAASWYEEKLGFRVVQRKSYPDFGTSLIFLELNGFRVELIFDKNAKPQPPRPNPPAHTAIYGISQFAFRTDDLYAVKRQLTARSVPIVWEFKNEDLGVQFLFIRDLNGVLIQYLEPLKGTTTQSKSP